VPHGSNIWFSQPIVTPTQYNKILTHINPLKTEFLPNNIQKFSPYLIVNTLRLYYKYDSCVHDIKRSFHFKTIQSKENHYDRPKHITQTTTKLCPQTQPNTIRTTYCEGTQPSPGFTARLQLTKNCINIVTCTLWLASEATGEVA
jgi:hypothetical protein